MTEQDFKSSPAEWAEDGLYLDNKVQLIDSHEELYIKKTVGELCKKLNPKSVLEIGFGLHFTADEFQKYNLDKHIIVESHPTIFDDAVEWSKDKKNVILINDFIQNITITERIDLIYDDRSELVYDRNLDLKNLNASYYSKFLHAIVENNIVHDFPGFEFIYNNKTYRQYLRQL
jgi:hypothetical protein